MNNNQKELAEPEDIFENINENLILVDESARIIFVNNQTAQLLGSSKNKLRGTNIGSLVSAKENDRIREYIVNQFKEKNDKTPFITVLTIKKSLSVSVEFSSSLIPWKGKKAVLLIVRKVLEHKDLKDDFQIKKDNIPELSNNKMRLLLKAVEKSKDLIVISDENGKVLYANPASIQKHDAQRQDYLNQSVFKWFAPYELERAHKAKEEAIREGFVSDKEFDIITKSGELIHIEMSAVPLKDEEDNLIGFAAILRDITKRKEMEKKLKEILFEQKIINKTILAASRLKKIDKICNILADAVHSLNKDCYIGVSFLDENAQSIPMRSMIGLGEYRSEILTEVRQYTQDLSIKIDEIGRERTLYTSGKIEHIPGGIYTLCGGVLPKKVSRNIEDILNIKKLYYIGFAMDENPIGGIIIALPEGTLLKHQKAIETLATHISALLLRNRAEENLKRSEKKYRQLYETMRDAYVKMDINGNILECNNEFLSLLGYTSEEITKKSYWELTPDTWRSEEKQIFEEQIITKGYSEVYEKECIKKDGTRVPVEVRISLLEDENGNPKGMWALIRNITERKKAKEKLIKSQQQYHEAYKKANFYKELLAHDVANILNKIGMGVEYAELKLNEDQIPETMLKSIDLIKSQVQNGKEIITKIRKISKIRNKKLDHSEINAVKLLHQVIKENPLFQRENNSISINTITDKKKVIAGPFLKDVFENILINAIQHNESENPCVSIKIREYEKDTEAYLRFDFKDNGRGIPDNIKEKIFTNSFKSNLTSSGMGIGLSLVKTIVEAYNGAIWVTNRVENNYKKGSIFSIILPKT
mgnify:CR=1 FL=1